MGNRNQDVSAAVAVAIWSGLMLVCLSVVLFYPGTISTPRWLRTATWGLALSGLPLLLRCAERSRIRNAVERTGGRVVRLRRLPFWRQDWFERFLLKQWSYRGPKYEVEFVDVLGRSHRAICRTSLLRGVEWLEDVPSGIRSI
jgi:hypothetical protein